MKNKEKKQPNLKTRLVFLYIGSFLVSIAPLLVVLILRWDNYTKTPGDTVKLCFGGAICLFFVFLKVIGKLKMPRRIVLFGVVFVMAYLLQALMDDLILLSGMALAGELLDLLCFQHFIKKNEGKYPHRKDRRRYDLQSRRGGKKVFG